MAVYLINRLPSPVLHGCTPYSKVYQKDPNYNGLWVFGCVCYPFRFKATRSKLDFKTSCCIFLGYSPSHKGYKCLDLASGNIFISRHVVFDECSFPLHSFSMDSPSPSRSQTSTIPPFPIQLFDSIHGSPIGISSSSLPSARSSGGLT
jgi:hypothetical protein